MLLAIEFQHVSRILGRKNDFSLGAYVMGVESEAEGIVDRKDVVLIILPPVLYPCDIGRRPILGFKRDFLIHSFNNIMIRISTPEYEVSINFSVGFKFEGPAGKNIFVEISVLSISFPNNHTPERLIQSLTANSDLFNRHHISIMGSKALD